MQTTSTAIGDLVLYKNNQFIAFNKPHSVPVQADKTGDKALIDLAEIYCKSQIFLINRLDRPASGITLFAKNSRAATALTAQLQTHAVKKTYLAVVKDLPEKLEGTLTHYLKKKEKTNVVSVFATPTKGADEAILHYKKVASIEQYHLLEIDLITGRHHQIRAQLAAIGSPIKGDVKYGARRSNTDRSIHLHAWKMEFAHAVTKEKVALLAPIPSGDSVWEAFKVELEKI
jgi:23S rRNA pseudouridine1911/1915/1917 synthase